MKPKRKVHIQRWAPEDWRTSRVRARSARTGDWMLRLVYREALDALYAAGGELPADPDTLADELLLPADEIARCLPLLDAMARQPGTRGGILVEDGVIRNARVSADLTSAREYISGQAEHGRASAEARREKLGTAQPQAADLASEGAPLASEGTPKVASEDLRGLPKVASGSPEPSVAVAVSVAGASAKYGNPPNPPAAAGGPGGGAGTIDTSTDGMVRVRYAPGDVLPDGSTVVEVDTEGRPDVVRPARPRLTEGELRAAVDRLLLAAGAAHLPADRAVGRRYRERLKAGEAESVLAAEIWSRGEDLAREAAEAEPFTPAQQAEARARLADLAASLEQQAKDRAPSSAGGHELDQALRLLPSSTVTVVRVAS